MNEDKEKIKPLKKAMYHGVSIAVFEKGVSVQKSYKDDTGAWVNNKLNLFLSDIDDLKKCLTELEL